ncbi:MAG: hypothetical protein LBC41_10775 [Clostridiales bacterium]|jgi:hypothetical protein|nr:hypothetical protein [Clostridiales bacterium]
MDYYSCWLTENNYIREQFAKKGFMLDYRKEKELNDIAGYLTRAMHRNVIGLSEDKLLKYDALLAELYAKVKAEQARIEKLINA